MSLDIRGCMGKQDKECCTRHSQERVDSGERWGNVHAKGRIEIKNDGSVNGDLTTPQIMIEDGAYFKGSIEIERTAETEAGKKISSGTQSAATALTAARAEPKSLST
jgi:cytoskeletal protein CcmA (bactofilin family)